MSDVSLIPPHSAKPDFPKQGEKTPETIIGPFDAAAIAAYAHISGDDNPLHVNAALAAAAGFSAPPVQGMLLLNAIAPALQAWRKDLTVNALSGTFVDPLLAGEQAVLTGRVGQSDSETGEIILRVQIQGPRRPPCVLGEARMRLRDEIRENYSS